MAKINIPTRYSKKQLLVFAAVFAVVGVFFLWRALAQTGGISLGASPQPAPYGNPLVTFSISHNISPQPSECWDSFGNYWPNPPGSWQFARDIGDQPYSFTWTVQCWANATISASMTITREQPPPPPPPAPTLSFSASPTTIVKGNSSTLSWNSSNASSCSASGAWSGSKPVDGSQSVSPGSSSTYTLSCSGSGGSVQKSATVTVNLVYPTVSLSASPKTITKGKSSTLSWSSTNASSCSASWTSSKATSGSKSVTPSSTTTYGISCTNPSGSRSATTTVFVTAPGTTTPKPVVRLAASPASIPYNGYSYLQWSSAYASSCKATWTTSKATVGTQKVGRLTASKTYSITCSGPSGSTSASTRVSVAAAPANCPPSCPTPKEPPPPKTDISPTLDGDFGFEDGFDEDGVTDGEDGAQKAGDSKKGPNWLLLLLALPLIGLFLWWLWTKSPLVMWIKVLFTIIPLVLLILLVF